MANPNAGAGDLHALLIGVNCYRPNRLPDGTFYRSLLGCVPDILHVERFLCGHAGLSNERLVKLTASDAQDPSDPRPPEPPELWPTYGNIVAAFHKLTDAARPGDHVYIHYSGHGGRAATLPAHRQLIPGKVVDEALVPTDIGDSEAQYIRDIELAFLLQKMVEKGLLVTMVLDSCHSGSATRGVAVMRGGGSVVDTTPHPARSLVADDEALAENWRRVAATSARDLEVGSGWLPDPRGYVLLAACRAHEGAYEFPFEGGEKRGALTYWLLDTLRKLGPHVTYRDVYRQVYARIHAQFKAQTPQLEGEGDRVVFGHESVHHPEVFTVMSVAAGARELIVNAGRVHRVATGARLAVFRAGEAGVEGATRAAVVEIVAPGVASSSARVVTRPGACEVMQGDEAVLLAPGTDAPRRGVRLLRTEGPVPSAAPLNEVAALLRRRGGGYLRLAPPDEDTDFHVSVNERGEYVVLDASLRPVPNIGPALSAADGARTAQLVERLIHLAKYLNLRELQNPDGHSAFAHYFTAELVRPPAARAAVRGAYAEAEPVGSRALGVGEWVSLRVRNGGGQPLNVTVLDLRPDWSVAQIFPSRAGLFETLEAGRELTIPLRADLPQGYDEGADLLKVFATSEAADFKGFQLPALGQPPAPLHPPSSMSAARGGDSAAGESGADTRDMGAPLGPEDDWTVLGLEVSVRRSGAASNVSQVPT